MIAWIFLHKELGDFTVIMTSFLTCTKRHKISTVADICFNISRDNYSLILSFYIFLKTIPKYCLKNNVNIQNTAIIRLTF